MGACCSVKKSSDGKNLSIRTKSNYELIESKIEMGNKIK
jgi:hypothetical protein